jgi:hypothetical protein
VAQPPQRPGVPRIGGGQPPELETGKERLANERLQDACKELEEELEEVKVKYDMYFLGVERMEPARRREDLKRAVARLQTAFTRNAGLRFRIQALHARFLSYERLWVRSAREKEEGTYRRDILRARRKAAARAPGTDGPKGALARGRRGALEAEDVDLDGLGDEMGEEAAGAAATADEALPGTGAGPPDAVRASNAPPAASSSLAPGTPPARAVPPPQGRPPAARPAAAAPAAAPPPAPLPGLAEAQMRALYEAYVAAKKRCNEDTSKVTYEAVARSVNKQIPEIARLYKAREVEFKVVIKDGKAILKAVPKTE